MLGRRGFKMTWSSSVSETGCGGDIGSSGVLSPMLDPRSGNYTIPQLCAWKHTAESENSTILYKGSNIQIRRPNGFTCTGDYLIFHVDHLRKRSIELCGSTEIDFPTSERVSRFAFIAEKGLRISNTPMRGFNLTYNTFPCGGVLSSGSNVITSPNFDALSGGYPEGLDCVWRLHYEEGEQITLDFNAFDLQSSPHNCENGDYLEIVNGPIQIDYPRLWKGCGVQLPARRLISMRNDLWIRFHTNEDNIKGRGFSLTALPLQNGCGGHLHGFKGNVSMPKEGTSKYENGMECIWEIEGKPGFDVKIDFKDRFEVEASSRCSKDYIQLQYWNEDVSNWTQIGDHICGREIPSTIVLPYHHVQIIFRSDNEVNGDGFKIHWALLCGGNFTQEKGDISSPGYPVAYDSNIMCTYNILASPTDYVLITFQEPFGIEEAQGCLYDSLWVTKSLTKALIGRYCRSTPRPISTQGPVTINFRSDHGIEKEGFKLSFEIHRCGGNITQDGIEIVSPMSPNEYQSNSNCTWFISAPENQVVEVKFSLMDLEASGKCRYDRVSAYDGHTLNRTHELARLCGNQSQVPILKSSGRDMTIHFLSDVSFAGSGFKAVVKFTYGASSGCGGMINMTNGESITIRSVDANGDGNYEMDLNCQWTVFTAKDKIVTLDFSSFDIESEENATYTHCWDYIRGMIYDGPGQFSPLIGEFCGSSIPVTAIKSSHNFLWINFFSDSTSVRGGFVGVLRVQDPPCGSHTIINATHSPQILTSPGYPNNYPLNLRCRWVIYAGDNDTQEVVHLNFLDFDVTSDQSCREDRLILSDLNGFTQASSHEFNSTIIHSSSNLYYQNFRSSYQLQNKELCGEETPSDFYSIGSMLQLDFISNHERTSKGFKLQYSIMGCNRTFDKPFGLILSPRFPQYMSVNTYCDFNISAPPGKTISIYFRVFRIPGSTNCTRSYLKVYDGLAHNSPLISNSCGYALPPSIHSSGSNLRLRMANTQYSTRGYEATYVTTDQGSGCGGELTDSRGVVTSPNYPYDYLHETDCTWRLSVPPGQKIRLRLRLSFGRNLSCADNYLELYDRNTISNTRHLVSKYCGNDNPSIHEGPYNSVDLHYVTGANNTGGWQAMFQYSIH